jgi:predicted ATPase
MSKFFFEEIRLEKGSIRLQENQVVCLVGPNSSGKSSLLQALHGFATGERRARNSQLQDAKTKLNFSNHSEVTNCRHISIRGDRVVWIGGQHRCGDSFPDFFGRWISEPNGRGGLRNAFVVYLDAHSRFSAVSNTEQINIFSGNPSHPFHIFYKDPELEEELASISRELFGKSTVLNPGAGSHLVLHFGDKIDPDVYGGNRNQNYANAVAELPQISDEGDGIKATIGLLSRVISGDYGCILIDEPDLYLHPPQAHSLAKILVREKKKTQLFFATHSARFLQGLFAEAPDRLKLIRLIK